MPVGLPPTPWIPGAPDLAGNYQRGYALGIAQKRLQQEAERTQAELEMQQRQADARAKLEQQQLEVAKAYKTAQLGIAQQKLQEAQQKINFQIGEATRKHAVQDEYQRRIANKEDPSQVMMELLPKMGQTGGLGAALNARRASLPPEPIQAAPIYEPGEGKVPIPGMVGVRSASGSMEARNIPVPRPKTDQLGLKTVAAAHKSINEIDKFIRDNNPEKTIREALEAQKADAKKKVNEVHRQAGEKVPYPEVESTATPGMTHRYIPGGASGKRLVPLGESEFPLQPLPTSDEE